MNTWCFAVGLAAVKDPPYEVGEALKGTRPVSPASTAAAAISIKGRRNKNMGDRGWLVELLCFRLWGDVSPTLHTLALLHSPCSLRFQNGENHPWQLACSGTPEFSRITGSPPCPCTSSIIFLALPKVQGWTAAGGKDVSINMNWGLSRDHAWSFAVTLARESFLSSIDCMAYAITCRLFRLQCMEECA